MKVEINIKKKHFIVLVALIVVSISIYVVAWQGTTPPSVSHTYNEMQGFDASGNLKLPGTLNLDKSSYVACGKLFTFGGEVKCGTDEVGASTTTLTKDSFTLVFPKTVTSPNTYFIGSANDFIFCALKYMKAYGRNTETNNVCNVYVDTTDNKWKLILSEYGNLATECAVVCMCDKTKSCILEDPAFK